MFKMSSFLLNISIAAFINRFSANLLGAIRALDKLLRSVTRIRRNSVVRTDAEGEAEVSGEELEFPILPMLITLCCLAMFYGLCMSVFALTKSWNADVGLASDRWMQAVASMIKVPSLFALTTLITFPSLYVFSALMGVRLTFSEFVRIVTILLAINLAVLASLGPVVAFFSVSTISYHFMQLFNVVMFTVAGGLGLTWMLGLVRDLSMSAAQTQVVKVAQNAHEAVNLKQTDIEEPLDGDNSDSELPDAPDSTQTIDGSFISLKWLFRFWVLGFGLVGSQMGWVLRPFIGNPDIAFTWFRERDSNFFEALFWIFGRFITG